MINPNESRRYLAGFDAGGTKIILSVENREGVIVHRARRECPGNIASAGGAAVARSMAEMLSEFAPLAQYLSVCAAVAGHSSETERAAFTGGLSAALPGGCDVFAMPDFQIYFHADWSDFTIRPASFHAAPRALVIAGTGSVVVGSAGVAGAPFERAFGRGAFISDPGSGFDLGLRFARLYLAAHDCGEATEPVAALLRASGFGGAGEVAEFLAPAGSDFRRRAASFAPLMIAAAKIPDLSSYRRGLETACGELARGAAAVMRKIARDGEAQPRVLLAGGLFGGSREYRDLFTGLLRGASAGFSGVFGAPADVSTLCADYCLKKANGEI